MSGVQEGHLPSHPDPSKTHSKNDQNNAPSYGLYQNHLYAAGMLHNTLPSVTTDPNKLEHQAKSKMALKAYNYVAGGAGERATMDANRLAFRTWKLVPRMLRPSGGGGQRSTRATILGEEYDSPVIVAPVGVQKLFHECGEEGSARAAAKVRVPYCMSTAASATIEQVAAASGAGERWYQLYWPQDHSITLSLLGRAKKAGFRVLLATLDTWALSWRPWDLDEAYVPFMTGMGNQVGFSDEVFRKMLKDRGAKSPEEDVVGASLAWQKEVFSGATHSWEDVKLLVDNWDGPVVLKGIQHPEDAKKAAEMGVKGIVVSNHGGRQMDGAVGSLEMLPEVVEALKGTDVEVLFDSGIRTGVDIIKAIALGAKGVLVGRPWVYGMGIAGEKGVEAALRGLLADLDQSMGLAGIASLNDLNKDWLRRSFYPGDRHSNN
ncbi:oxidoreductase [Myriangium duriaei CBS 260.36]|uniref:Oxidoreductase n=1 Tax=Myriangium duriaei CBS 260.36 TaxID=1168546 RepID=A0A9P4IVW9_9PEZI|nr:oxidoreductase [Myriangium duriaei CBS 260.36]